MKIIFAGTPEFSVPALQSLIASEHTVVAVYTQPDRPAGRGKKMQASAIKQCALENTLAIEQPLNFKSDAAVEQLKSYQADLMVVVAYGLILPSDVLMIPTYGCINIHASLLPRWRGAAPIQRSILAADKETGITMMQMDEGLDTGDMLSQIRCPINETDNAGALHDKLSALGGKALSQLLPSIESQQLAPIKQDESLATYAKKLSKQEAKIDWQQAAGNILAATRAYAPWPVSYSSLGDKTLRIWQAQASSETLQDEPGMVHINNKKFLVCCGQHTCIEITELQLAGKKRMSAQAYLAAHSPAGQILGKEI